MNIVAEKMQIGSGKFTVMVKDSIDIQGYKTKSGSRSLENSAVAQVHAQVIKNLLAHDCTITAKTNLHELAFGITGINHALGTPINPKYPELIPGGSSSGSAAAIAAHLADFTLGTDTGGSVRMPAACCGVYGLKPTFGRVSRKGVHPEHSSLDCVGPFANSVEMIETAMQFIDPSFHAMTQDDLPQLAILNVQADVVVQDTIQDFLKKAQMQLPTVDIKTFNSAYDAGMQIINYENWQAYGELTKTGLIGADVQGRLLKAADTTLVQVKQAEKVKAQFTQEIDALLEKYDALLLPTLPQIPPRVIDAENTVAFLNLTALVRPFNLSGHPAITIPLETKQGLPVGLQIITKRSADEQLCAIAKFIVNAAH